MARARVAQPARRRWLVTHDLEEALVPADRLVVMRGHPGHIHETVPVELPRPRPRTHAAFQGHRQRLLKALDVRAVPA